MLHFELFVHATKIGAVREEFACSIVCQDNKIRLV